MTKRSTSGTPPAPIPLPPCDVAAEEAVIAACLVDATAPATLLPLLTTQDFYREKHGWVWEAMAALHHAGQPVNQITVAAALARKDRLEPVGGNAFLAQITADLPTTVGAEWYAEGVRRTAQQRRLIAMAGQLAQRAYSGDDPQEVVAATSSLLREVLRGDTRSGWQSLRELIDLRWEQWLAWAANPRAASRAMPTGLRALDRLLLGGGLQRGKLYLLGGSTSMGKSTVMRAMLRNVAMQGYPVALLSLEQDRDEVIEELAFSTAGIDQHDHERTGAPLTEDEERRFMDALGRLGTLPFYVDDEPRLTPTRAVMKLEALRAEYPSLAVVGMDYAQIFAPEGRRRERHNEHEEVVEAIRDAGKRMGLTVLLGSQLVKEAMDKKGNPDLRPRQHHILGGTGVVNVAFCAIGLFRPDRAYELGLLDPPPEITYVEGGRQTFYPTHQLEVHVLKQQRGPVGMALLRMVATTRAVSDMEA